MVVMDGKYPTRRSRGARPEAGEPLNFTLDAMRSRLAFCVLGMFSWSTGAWIAWGYFTPGDYFANGSSWLLPSLLATSIGGALFGFIAQAALVRGFIVAMVVCAVAFWLFAADGWWAHNPPQKPLTLHSRGAPIGAPQFYVGLQKRSLTS